MSRIDVRTVVVGLSAGRPHPLITRTMKLARHRHAPTVAITDATLSEVARLARIRLYYARTHQRSCARTPRCCP